MSIKLLLNRLSILSVGHGASTKNKPKSCLFKFYHRIILFVLWSLLVNLYNHYFTINRFTINTFYFIFYFDWHLPSCVALVQQYTYSLSSCFRLVRHVCLLYVSSLNDVGSLLRVKTEWIPRIYIFLKCFFFLIKTNFSSNYCSYYSMVDVSILFCNLCKAWVKLVFTNHSSCR